MWPGPNCSYGTPQSLAGGCLIGISYSYATYSVGTSYAGYTINDFIASVQVTSAAGNPLFNQEHDITSWAGCTGTAGQNCNRHSPHPPDYTLFGPVNLGATKDRSLNLKFGQGFRTGTPADVISIAAGTWFSANYVRTWIDFNGDGDFDDYYTGTGGVIYESINVPNAYPLSDNQAIGSLGSIPGAFPPGKIGDDWNQWNIQVPNLGELPTVGGLSAGPATKLGSVRMRVREVWATNTFTPYSGHTYGETEDYDVALVDNCPAPGSKYCKWISGGPNPTDWMTAANWCPGIPTQYDTALISPNGDGNYPIITSNQNPVCATLRIFSGANVTVDAADALSGTVLVPNTGKLKAYHNVEIGEALSTAAQLKVASSYVDSVFTGLPSASGNAVISPFRNDKQDHKIQFIYSPTEQTVMGLKSGDLLNSITFYIRSTTALAAGNLGNFTVKIWQMDNVYTFPAVLVPSTEVAVNDVAPTIIPSTGAVVPTTCFTTLSFAIPAITANVTTPITINFTNRFLVNTTKYMCIEVTRDNAFTLGVGYPVLYESSLLRNCLTLLNANNNITANSNASFITGPGNNIGAAGTVAANGILNNGTFVNGGTGAPLADIRGTTYVFRPTSKLGVTKRYSRYPIEVGGNWINNNSSGAAGFQAGWSRVSMLNNYVAVLHPNNDMDTIGGGSATIFNELELNDANGFQMRVQGINNGNLGITCDSSLVLTNGQLDLNQHRIFINNPNITVGPTAVGISRTAGTILSENTSNFNKVEWKINTTPGAHLIPFGVTTAPADYVPFTIAGTAGDLGNVTVSTYRTTAANTPVPTLPIGVNNLFNSTCVDNSANTVDRFWQIDRSTSGAIAANVTFGYTASENTTGKAFTSMVAQRYDAAAAKACGVPTGRWSNPTGAGQTATSQSTSNVGYLSVTANGVSAFSPWAASVIESPLPLQLVNFDAKLMNDKVKVYWTVANENNMDKYEVYKTLDKNTFDFIGAKKPTGPAVGGLSNYELWDNNPVQGTQYYRLKSVDNTGEEKLSNLVQVDYKIKVFGLTSVIANDATGGVNIEFVNNSEMPLTINVVDMYGRVVYAKYLGTMPTGKNTLQIPAAVAKGVYTIALSNDNNRDAQTFVK
ncbi:MAG: T9SS type A sorting domain-containing protein [Bacteroidetes bacterium]|nr:T9SS type A sorting domain-containing protein [Bacteroidota bacterium]